jgi:hypothetical protein
MTLIKVQAVIRGYLVRKQIRMLHYEQGVYQMNEEYYHGQTDGGAHQNYDNDRVAQIRAELGEFNYDEEPNYGEYATEWRSMVELENRAKYEGEW